MTMTDTKTPEQTAEETRKALEVYQVDSAMTPDMGQVTAYAKRIKKTIPGTKDLTDWGAVALANYGLATGANLARGELYGYEDSHGLHITEGYKLLVRWAKSKCDYSEWFEPYDTDKGIGFTCYILRKDKLDLLELLLKRGMDNAMDIVTTSATGIVRTQEMGKPAPNGWDWEQVAKKRALKNALNIAYGMPSPEELAAETWQVDEVATIDQDWEDTPETATPQERKATAKYNAKRRKFLREQSTKTADQLKAEAATRQPRRSRRYSARMTATNRRRSSTVRYTTLSRSR